MINRWSLSKVGYRGILHSKFSSGLVFENFLPFISAATWSAIAMINRWSLSKVGYRVILHSNFSSWLIFENFYQFISTVSWSVIAMISRQNSQKSAIESFYIVNSAVGWFLRISSDSSVL